MNELMDYLSLQEFAREFRSIRAAELVKGNSTTSIKDALDASPLSTTNLVTAVQAIGIDNIYASNSVNALNVKKGLGASTDSFGNVVEYNTFNSDDDVSRYQQAQFNDVGVAARRIEETGGTLLKVDGGNLVRKSDDEIIQENIQTDIERQQETEELFGYLQPNEIASQQTGEVAVDSSFVNTIERNGDGTTSVQIYSEKGIRTYTYPDAASNAFDDMYNAHTSGGSVGKAFNREVIDTGIGELFTVN